ncbi:MAG: hypothetical protein LAO55_21800 [Acidobacteriia bacterium]|nr:hypothetical protein [Terriglobia bacterium]
MKRFSSLKNGLPIAALALLGCAILNPLLKADEYNRKTVITINQPLEVPGVVLAPGTYVMRLFNSSSDRHIVQFMTEDQKQQLALTFAVAADRVRPTGRTVLTMYEGARGEPPAIRTWFYPGDVVGQEFLYPHKQAVRISERTNQNVPEVETGQAASAKEAAAAVVPAAEPAKSNESPGESVFIAKAEPAPPPAPAPIAAPEPQQPAAEQQSPAANNAQAPAEPPAATAADDTLPKTAGKGPLAALIGGLSFILAFCLRKMKGSRLL